LSVMHLGFYIDNDRISGSVNFDFCIYFWLFLCQVAISASNAGGAWENVKMYIEVILLVNNYICSLLQILEKRSIILCS
jgi:hypothetical protein